MDCIFRQTFSKWAVLLLPVLFLSWSTATAGAKKPPAANATSPSSSTPTSRAQLGDDPGPVYTQLMTQWAKVTHFSQNAAEVVIGKLKLDMQKDPKLQKALTPAFLADLEQFFYELYLSPETMKDLAKLYSQYFTIDEIAELLKFYRSPVGQKLIKLDPELKVKTQQIGMQLLKNHEKQYMELVAKHVVKEQ